MEKAPPVSAARAVASSWPMVPLTEKVPPWREPPPSAMACQEIEGWALAGEAAGGGQVRHEEHVAEQLVREGGERGVRDGDEGSGGRRLFFWNRGRQGAGVA